jgi:hypothetical protein
MAEAYSADDWSRWEKCAMEQAGFEGQRACVLSSNRENLYIPIPAFEGRTWMQQIRKEAEERGAELVLHRGNWFTVWGVSDPVAGP